MPELPDDLRAATDSAQARCEFWTPWELHASNYAARFLRKTFSIMWPDEQCMTNVPASYAPRLFPESSIVPADEIPTHEMLRDVIAEYVAQLGG